MWLNMLPVYIFLFVWQMEVFGSFHPHKKVNTFVLLEINCKINSLGVLKSLILYINDVMKRYYI